MIGGDAGGARGAARRAGLVAGAAMLVVYAATLAPGVTFWDAGEFIAAAHALGIPHPPGTPLFVVALNAWARGLGILPYAVATNLLSAVCTAAAVAITSLLVARATRSMAMGVAAGLTAGAMTTVWQNATETEVYAASLFVSVGAVVAAELAGRTGERRWLWLSAYCLALALPLHLSILVSAPVAIYLASARSDHAWDPAAGALLLGTALCAVGMGRLSPALALAGVAVMALGVPLSGDVVPGRRLATALITAATAAAACSALLIMLVRARHDPAVNQANPSSLSQLAYVVGRRQYDVAGLWPRQAPLWLQAANWFEYADWQVALSLGRTVIPTVWRVAATVSFGALGVFGAVTHRRLDRRTWRAVLLLFLCGSVGVGLYLNLKAGASFAWSFVPDGAHHEARDRDYFFVLSFWAWGMWAGIGAVALASRLGRSVWAGVAVAALPIALNWAAVSRRSEPEAGLPRETALALLGGLPPRTVLFVAGDNDSYPLWYAQQVEGTRRDVTVVTMPLLGAPWYAAELDRREHLLGGRTEGAVLGLSARIAGGARAAGRPVAVSVTVPAGDRNHLGHRWTDIGLSYLSDDSSAGDAYPPNDVFTGISFDTTRMRAAAAFADAFLNGRTVRPSLDPVHEYFFSVLSCPHLAGGGARPPQFASLDSICNLR